jgi:hypothetical protein
MGSGIDSKDRFVALQEGQSVKQWWAKYKERLAERQRIADADMERFAAAVAQMRLEEWERREAKRLVKSAAKGQCRTPSILVILVSLFLPDSYALLVLGDLAETYSSLRRKRGRFRAYMHVHKQVLYSVPPIVWQCIRAGDGAWLLSRIAWIGLILVAVLLLSTIISQGGPDDMGFSRESLLDFPYPI